MPARPDDARDPVDLLDVQGAVRVRLVPAAARGIAGVVEVTLVVGLAGMRWASTEAFPSPTWATNSARESLVAVGQSEAHAV